MLPPKTEDKIVDLIANKSSYNMIATACGLEIGVVNSFLAPENMGMTRAKRHSHSGDKRRYLIVEAYKLMKSGCSYRVVYGNYGDVL